ncbi:maestro heat-like repeat-containing protein family member 1 [Amia ocellicauda]|uniref:maestro heat-like repeat-containing protein family member 1 n=1 Tax=Amia ocellicauda TaxID=2972642 RepID=UPI003463C9C1
MKRMVKQGNTSSSCDADEEADLQSQLDCLEKCLRNKLPFFEEYLANKPQVASEDRLVILEAVETVARNEPLPDVERLIVSIISVGLSEMPVSIPNLEGDFRNETNVLSRVVLCYGFIARMSPKSDVAEVLEFDILPKMSAFFRSEDPTVRASVCVSLGLMARTVKDAGLTFPFKEELLGELVTLIKDRPTDSSSPSLCQRALDTCTILSRAKPFLRRQQLHLVWLIVEDVLTLPWLAPNGDSLQEVYSANARSLSALLRAMLRLDFTPDTLLELLKPLQALGLSVIDVKRIRAMAMITALLEGYWMEAESMQVQGSFPLGQLLASLVPRCFDPEPVIRGKAAHCIRVLLDHWLRTGGFEFGRNKLEDLIRCIERSRSVPDTCAALLQIVGKCFPRQEKERLIEGLRQGLKDNQTSSAQGSCTLLCSILEAHPTELTGLLPQVLHAFLGLRDAEERVRESAKEGVLQLFRLDSVTVVNSLINYSSADSTVQQQKWCVKLWGAILAISRGLWPLSELMALASTGQAVAARAVVDFLSENSLEALNTHFVELFAGLLPLLGPESPALDAGLSVRSTAVDALKAVLSQAQLSDVLQHMDRDRVWELLREPGREPEGIFLLTRALLRFDAPGMPAVVTSLCERYSSMGESQKICVVDFFSALLQHPHLTDHIWSPGVMERLLAICGESLEDIDSLAVRGLQTLPKKEIHRYATKQLEQMTGALSMSEEQGKPVILRAISGLGTSLQFCENGTVKKLIPKVYHQAKVCIEKADPEIRRATVVLLGALVKRAVGNEVLKKQCHGSLARLLLHLEDSNPAVSQACQRTLQQCAPALNRTAFTSLIEEHFGRVPLELPSFIKEVTAVLQQTFPGAMGVYRDVVLRYQKSRDPELRASAAVFIGALLEKMEKGFFNLIPRMRLNKGLSRLLKDQDSRVKKKAAEAMVRFLQA